MWRSRPAALERVRGRLGLGPSGRLHAGPCSYGAKRRSQRSGPVAAEVATALTGASPAAAAAVVGAAANLQLLRPPSHKTEAGGFTERRYTPIDLLELMVLADLRRKGSPWRGFASC